MKLLNRRSRDVLGAVALALLVILAAPCLGQLPAIPGMPAMPQPDPVEAQKRVFAQLARCQTAVEEPSTAVQERTFCRFLNGLVTYSTGRRDEGRAAMLEAGRDLEAAGDSLGRIVLLLQMADSTKIASDRETAVSVLDTALDTIATLRQSEEPLSVETLRFFSRLGGMPDDYIRHLDSIQSVTRSMTLNQFELQARFKLGEVLVSSIGHDAAEPHLVAARALSKELLGIFDAPVLDLMGQLRERQGRPSEAAQLYGQAAAAARLQGDDATVQRLEQRRRDLETPEEPDSPRPSEQDGDPNPPNDPAASDDPLVQLRSKMERMAADVLKGDHEEALAVADGASELAEAVARERPELAHVRASVAVVLGGLGMLRGRPERLAIQVEATREALGDDTDELSAAWLEAGSELAKHLTLAPNNVQGALGDLAVAMRRSGASHLARHAGTVEAMSSLIELDSESLIASRGLADDAPTGQGMVNRALGLPGAMLEGARGDPAVTDDLRSAAEWFVDSGFRDLGAVSRMSLATVHLVNGRLNEAAREALAAIDAFDAVADGIAADELLGSFVGRSEGFFGMAVWLVATEIGAEEALVAAEKVRARALSSSLDQRAVDRRAIVDPELARQLAARRQRVVELADDPSSPEKELAVARSEYREVLTRVQLTDRTTVPEEERVPVDLAAFRRDVIPDGTDLIVFFVTPRSVLAWVVDREGIEQLQLPIPRRAEIDCLARWFRHSTRGGEPIGSWTCDGEPVERLNDRLYSRWIEPLESVARHNRWILVPHDLLHYVPFVALRDAETGERLIDRRTIAYAPSVSALRLLTGREVEHGGRALVLGNPETALPSLPGAEREALDVARFFGAIPRLGAEARESLLFDAEAVDVIHLAAHGVYRQRAPRFSYLALAEGGGFDGDLEIDEVAGGLDLDGVDLVTLSACQTALGEHQRGDEILSLPHAFLQAGAPAVVSTLWRVDDTSTAFLMRTFYEHLRAGVPYGDALRRAQLDTAAQSRWSDPFDWAAFVLTGDPEIRWATSG